ncbi:MAG TPA: hypothetical protein VFV01_16970 [Spirillospora sp.]|nr:hypothetical protein [Spirillospora sp.]
MTTGVTCALHPLNRAEVAFLRERITEPLAHAEKRRDEKNGEWLYWSARVDVLSDALLALDYLCASEPWYEPTTPAATI